MIVRPAQVDLATKIIAAGEIPFGPRVEPCVCGAGRHEHSGDLGSGRAERTGCRRFRLDPAWALVYAALDADALSLGHALRDADRAERDRHYRRNPRGEGEWSIGASDTSTCPRKIQYRNRPPEDFEPAPEDQREARIGTMIHNDATRQLKALYPWRLFDHKVRIGGLDRQSALDMFDPVTGVLTDVKTAGDWRWDQLGDFGPEWSVWEQVLLYCLAMEEAGHLVTQARLAYIKRCNGHDENFTMPWDDEARLAAEAARDRLIGYAQALDLGQELPRTGTGPSTDALCRRCFARFHCWNVPLAERLGRSPENVTHLGVDPAEPEVIHAIETKVSASAARLAAEKVEKEAKALVDGLVPGRYGPGGEYEVYESHVGGKPLYKDSYEQVLDYLDLPDGERPTREVLSPVRGSATTTTKVGRTRKAILEGEAKAARVAARAGKAAQ